MTINFADLNFTKNGWGQLVLSLPDGTTYQGIEPIRCFPLSDPTRTIALLDAEGSELFNLPDLEALNPAAREFLRRELTEREFIPVVERILSTSASSTPCRWEVQTDRGLTSFQLESDDDIRRLGTDSVIVADSNGIRYKIPDVNVLDAHSQRIVRRHV